MRGEILLVGGVPGPSKVVDSSDVATLLTALATTGVVDGNRKARGAIISVEGNPIRIAFGGISPTAGALGSGAVGIYLNIGDSMAIDSPEKVATARIISANAGAHAKIQVNGSFEA
ncbi:MAG: hypothetical protein AAGU11_08690 [Syntrophobacteraceae bacterium]